MKLKPLKMLSKPPQLAETKQSSLTICTTKYGVSLKGFWEGVVENMHGDRENVHPRRGFN